MVYDYKGFVVRQVLYFLFVVASTHFSVVIARHKEAKGDFVRICNIAE
jgi:hypothetical protein